MTARANIAVADGEASPVTHTFVPAGDISVDVAAWINSNVTVPAASERMTLSVKESPANPDDYSTPGKKVAPRSVELRIRYPATYTDAVSGLTLVDFVDEAIVTFKRHPRSSVQRGDNLRMLVANTLTTANGNQVIYAVEQNEKIW